ncbi:MAG TPA: CynX/NimT family MFS transporter [Pusillimonas sp.]|uniref:CynX/NimT family MFS transporter n=1 Tax=Pusillimonas sp. TaxID=3040095 RepID=UPI002CF77DB6|nr:CynX/NimT family MFS transporter [Pusillimonas sp.]HUH87674.1 CynX/NimT family MFS transporter [Pusillimonas sp.]
MALIAALILVSINLRPMLTGLGPVLDSIRESLQLSGAAIGMLITLPVLCFGAFAPFVPRLLRFASPERLILWSLGVLVVGISVRSLFGTPGLFIGTLIGGASISVVMVLLPSIIKQRFPTQAGSMMGLYSTALCVGAAISAAAAVPLENLLGGWRWSLAFWLVPVLAIVPIWMRHIPRKQAATTYKRMPLPKLRGNKLAWQITLMMGLQSAIAYCVFGWLPVILIDRGLPSLTAGFVLSVALAVQLISSPAAPWLSTRGKDQRLTLMSMLSLTFVGLSMIFYAPLSWVWVSSVVMGLGMGGTFSIALALLVLRAPNALVATALSGMAQGVGYTIAGIAPLLMGLLHELTGEWNAVAALFALLVFGSAYFGLQAGRARFIQID